MKYTKSTYLALIFSIALLTYNQFLGLNALIIPLLLSLTHYFSNRKTLSYHWITAATLWIFSGFGIFLWHLDVGIPLFLIAGLHYFAITYHSKISLPSSLGQSIISFFTGIGRFFNIGMDAIQLNTLTEGSKKLVRIVLLISISLIIFIIFLKLYQSASPEFAELTAFINFKFIKVTFFVHFAIIAIFTFGFFNFKPSGYLLELDLDSKDDLNRDQFIEDVEKSKSTFEWQIGLIIVTSLCVLLAAFVVIDFSTVFGNSTAKMHHSKSVHQSINILITSIVMVIIIVLYLFRGAINYKSSSALKNLTYVWLILNCMVVFLICIKNSQYIEAWGLTHKRIGVFIYSLLCIVGITLTIIKLYLNKTTTYLIKNTSTTFLTTLVVYGLFNWNGIIVSYNLNENNLAREKLDLLYLANLGPESYPQIIDHLKRETNGNKGVIFNLESKINSLKISYMQDWTYFLSYTYSGYKTYKLLKHYKTENFSANYTTF